MARTYEQGLADGQVQAALAILDHRTTWAPHTPTPASRIWDKALATAARIAEAGDAPPGPRG